MRKSTDKKQEGRMQGSFMGRCQSSQSSHLLSCGHQMLKESLADLTEHFYGGISFIEDLLLVSICISFYLPNNPMS